MVPGCSSIPGSLTQQDGTGWRGLEKRAKAKVQMEFFCPLWKQARGRVRAWLGGTGGRQGVLLTRLSASGFGATDHPAWFCSFSSSFPGPGQPQGTELSWTDTCVPGIAFPTTSF